MNISAQVIDTIVEWIDDNLHQPLRIDDLRAMPGIRNGICNGCFTVQRESLGRYIRERKTAAGGATCEIPTSGFMIFA